MNYIITMLLLVSCMSTYNNLLCFARFCAGSTPKLAKKKARVRTGSWKTWKVMEFKNFISRPRDLWNLIVGP